MDILDVPMRSAIRYVHELRDADVPIEHEGEGSARRAVLPQEFVRAGFVFAQGDAFALHIARAGIPHLDGTVVDEWLGELVEKLEFVETATTTTERCRRFGQRFVHIADPYLRAFPVRGVCRVRCRMEASRAHPRPSRLARRRRPTSW